MKKAAIITSHCNTEEKINALIGNIEKIKSIGNIDVILTSHIPLPEKVVNLTDYFIFDKSNPILRWPERGFRFWQKRKINNEIILLNVLIPDYGWTPFNQILKGSSLVQNLNYDYFYFLNYDLQINDEIISFINENKLKSTFFDVESNGDFFRPGLLFFGLSPKDLKKINSILDIEVYKRENIAEDYFRTLIANLDHDRSKIITRDQVRFYKNETNWFNNSEINYFSYFISNSDILHSNYFKHIVFYNVVENLEVIIDGNIVLLEKNKEYLLKYNEKVEYDGIDLINIIENKLQFIEKVDD